MRNNFLKVVDLLHLAKQSGIRVVLNDDQLQLTFVQKKAIDKALLEEIKENKQLIVEYLGNKNGKSTRVEKDFRHIDGSARALLTHIPLSFSQERLWFIDQLEGSVQYHLPTVLRLKGNLNIAALESSLQQIVDRHEVLRTVIGSEGGEPYQYFKASDGWHLQVEPAVIADEKSLQQYINALVVAPFDLSSDYMLRAHLLKSGVDEHVLVVTLHHIASDAWSVSVIVKEVVELYRAHEEGREANLSSLPIQYADYAIWQRNYLQGDVLEKKLSYWKEQLTGVTPLQLPLDYTRPAIQSTRGAVAGFTVDKELSAQLQLLSQQQGTTMFMTLLSVFNVLLYRYSGQQDICVGTPIAGRQHQQVEALIGFFINTLALRSNLSDHPSFTSLLQQVRATTLSAYDHQEIPFEKLVEVLVKERDRSRSPLFQVMFLLQNTPEVPALQLGDVQLSREASAHHTAKFELTFNITQTSNGLQGAVEYCTDLFTEQTIARMIGHFKALLQSVVASPTQQIGKLPMLSGEEQQQLLIDFNATGEAARHDKTFITLFEEQVSNTPDNIALVFGETELSYGQLNARANQLAHYLRSKGVQEETLVPICIERSIDMVTAILGILKSGAAYVPVDPEYPRERIAYLLEDTGASVIISNEKNKALLQNGAATNIISIDGDSSLIGEAPPANLSVNIGLNHLAYIIYTSGSTGKPKGVMIEHHQLLSYLLNDKTKYISQEPGNAGSFIHLSYTFDASLTGMFMPLLAGRSVVIGANSSVDVFEENNLHKYAPYDFIKLTPAHLELLQPKMQLSNGQLLTKQLVIGGEALLLSQFNSFVEEGLNVHIVNEYGPTEATVGCSVYGFDTMGNNESMPNHISIGKPIDGVQLYILGDSEELVPAGVGGELCIAGAGLARGYLNREALTAEKFVSNPFNVNGGTKMYKTGDLAKWLPDGNIAYLGRKDEQVKIRGYRIELGEIESVLNEMDQVKQAVVLAKPQPDGSRRLVAYVVPVDTFDKASIISYLSAKLPDYMVPVQWVSLESLPLTINGKIDRKALPDPSISEQLSHAYAAPRNSLESKLVKIWQQLLQVERVGIHDNFFELGGHSLLVMRLVSAIRKELQVEIAVKSLFNHPTVAALAVHLEEAGEGVLLPEIEALPRPAHIPLSFSQERLWFIDQLEGSVQYHLPTVLRLKGNLNIAALESTLQQIVDRHEVLRTVIGSEGGEPYQYFKASDGWHLQVEPAVIADEKSLQQYINALVVAPFDLSSDYMLRAHLLKSGVDEHVLVVTLHHIASDAWSVSVIVKEVVELYRAHEEGREANLSSLPIQYADYAIWQRNYLQGDVLEKKLSYWKEQLTGVTPLQLPLDYTRPAIQSTRGAVAGFTVDKELSAQLQLLSQQQGTTMFMTLLSVFNVLLYRYSGQQDICVGTPIAGRQHQQVEALIGFFINTLALRSNLSDHPSFTSLLQQVRATTLSAYDHQEIPFEKLVEVLVKERDRSRSPLFQVMFLLQNTPEVPALQLGDVQLSREASAHHTAKFELTFNITQTSNGLQGAVEYCTDLFTEQTIARMIGHFKALLQSVVASPTQQIGKLPMLSGEEQQQLLIDFNATGEAARHDKTFITLFEEQVSNTPDNIALVFGETELSYGQLNARANQLAHYLRSKGVQEETLVPICIERSIDMVTAILGILKSGAAYVPVDPEYPRERIAYLLEDTGASVIISNEKNKALLQNGAATNIISIDGDSSLIGEAPPANLSVNIGLNHLAYIIYTSGSTGKPKGVMIEHHQLLSYLLNDKTKYISQEPGNAGSFIHLSYTFDASLTGMFMPLLAGRSVVIGANSSVDVFEENNLHKYAPYDFIKLTPAHLELLQPKMQLSNGQLLTKQLVIGGEALLLSQFNSFVEEGLNVHIVNEYGPTEATVGCSVYGFDTMGNNESMPNHISIGKPIDGVQLYILGDSEELVPAGVGGELCIAGAGLARGYLNREALTAEKFVSNPFNVNGGTKMYKTGDLAKWLPDGNIAYLGRKDEQVKIRGYRIELGEIESVLNEMDQVKQAVVLAKPQPDGSRRLVAYVVPVDTFDKASIISYLSAKLPDYMVPVQWVSLESLPLTINGKIDRKALPDPSISEQLSHAYAAPRNSLESKLVKIWQQLLQVERVGIHDNFFELGGHSLLVMRLVSAIRKELLVEIAVKSLFNHPTVAALAVHLEEAGEGVLLPEIEALPRPAHIPLSFSQERLWFIDQLEGSVQYHLPTVLRLKGELNMDALVYALQQLINRHEVLRTVIRENAGEGYQYIKDQDGWEIKVTEGAVYEQDQEGLKKYIRQIINLPFNLSQDYMLRAELIILNELENVLLVNMHHIASDGWSSSVIVSDLMALYLAFEEGKPNELLPLKIQYADYAIWQRNYLQGAVLEKKLGYWKQQLDGVATLQLPTDFQRPVVQSTRGATAGFVLDEAITEKLRLLSQQQGTTMFMTLLAVFKVLLYRHSGQQDICVGIPIAGRHQQELESLVGFFINTLALRSQLDEEASFNSLLQQVRTTTLEAYDHQDVPFEKVVDAVSRERDMSKSPLFQVMFIMQNTPHVPDLRLGNVALEKLTFDNTSAKFDITFYIAETNNGLQGIMEYCSDLFSPSTIERMLVHFKELINAVTVTPEKPISLLPMLTSEEQRELVVDFNNTKAEYPEGKTLIGLFEEQVVKTPENIAVIFEEGQFTFRQLNELSNQFAHYLQGIGVKAGDLVPICIERSIDMVTGILGILKASAAYVPIDADYPEERIGFMLEDTGALIVVTNTTSQAAFKANLKQRVVLVDRFNDNAAWPVDNLLRPFVADSIVALTYTSGSSGRPKGVSIPNAGIVNRMHWMWAAYPFGNNEVCALKTSIGFVDHMWELFGPLAKGVTTILFKKRDLLDLDSLVVKLADYKITRWVLVPSLLKVLLEKLQTEKISLNNLQYWTCSGEAITSDLIQDFYKVFPADKHKLLNIYGSSEVTADVTCYDTSLDFVNLLPPINGEPVNKNINGHSLNKSQSVSVGYSKVPIGKPIANSQVFIVDKSGQLVAKGVTGEILVGGVQVAPGYLNLPDLTAEKFIDNPFIKEPGNRLYRSGDLGCWLNDGNIAYLGRKDDQVKIRGYRIEPGEIERVLLQSALVADAVVLAKNDPTGNKRLVCYVVPHGVFDQIAIQSYLKTRLPEFMIPSVWVMLETLPLTHNGKLDKKALPEPGVSELIKRQYVAPGNELELNLVTIWQEILRIERVGIHDNFFELGGHSLLAIRLVSAIRSRLEIEITINDVFIYPTVAAFAGNIVEKVRNPSLPFVNIKYLVGVKPGGNKIPVYIVCGAGGTALRFKKFAEMMDADQPVYVLQPPIDGNASDFPKNFEAIAKAFIEEVLIQNPEGPYALSGHCLGGFIAFEMAKQLEALGKKVHMLAMFDVIIRKVHKYDPPSFKNFYHKGLILKRYLGKVMLKLDFETFLLRKHTKHAIKYKMDAFNNLFNKVRYKKNQSKVPVDIGMEIFDDASGVYIAASKNYRLVPYNGEMVLFYAKDHYYFMDRTLNVEFKKLYLNDETKNMWKDYTSALKIHDVEGEHSTIFDPEHGNEFARLLQHHLDKGTID